MGLCEEMGPNCNKFNLWKNTVNFTREPIIETIISAREGYKLSLKSSKTVGGEEHLVDALEVVSFGGSFFYRCSEKPKPFFFPASDYESVEVRETRLLIKTVSLEKAIKIGGGKDQSRQQQAKTETISLEAEEEEVVAPTEEAIAQGPRQEQKRDKRRHRKKKGNREDRQPRLSTQQPQPSLDTDQKEGEVPVVTMTPPPYNPLLRPPESLISESLQKKFRREDTVTAPEVASIITPVNETIVSEWTKTEETIFTEEILTDRVVVSEAPSPRDRLEEDHDDSLIHLSFPDFEDRL